jgi:hypothetical protein
MGPGNTANSVTPRNSSRHLRAIEGARLDQARDAKQAAAVDVLAVEHLVAPVGQAVHFERRHEQRAARPARLAGAHTRTSRSSASRWFGARRRGGGGRRRVGQQPNGRWASTPAALEGFGAAAPWSPAA